MEVAANSPLAEAFNILANIGRSMRTRSNAGPLPPSEKKTTAGSGAVVRISESSGDDRRKEVRPNDTKTANRIHPNQTNRD